MYIYLIFLALFQFYLYIIIQKIEILFKNEEDDNYRQPNNSQQTTDKDLIIKHEEMFRQQYWTIRQNPYSITNQTQMRELIISQSFVSCPFGHLSELAAIALGLSIWGRDNVVNGVYNEQHSNSQDRKFIENMNIGDIIVIPFAKLRECILARIVSDPIYGIDTGLFTSMRDGKIQVTNEGDTPFRPVGRKIHIIRDDVIFNDKRVLPRVSLARINPNILPK